ncbi:MAG: cohesin domain-containing protein [Candidatus Shapirobacteria bacterium]|jgi:hypothetical protein
MNLKVKFLLVSLVAFLMLVVTPVKAFAAPRFTFTPATGTYTVGSNIVVVLGAESDAEKVLAMDVMGSFDATKLELLSVERVSAPAFNFTFDAGTAKIQNDSGTFEMTLAPTSTSLYDSATVSGPLLTFTFRTKAVGTAIVNLACTQGNTRDTNIANQDGADVVSCAANQSGSYTIVEAASGPTPTSNPAATPTPLTSTSTTTTTTTSTEAELPRTGGFGPTMGLLVFGSVSILSILLLGWL